MTRSLLAATCLLSAPALASAAPRGVPSITPLSQDRFTSVSVSAQDDVDVDQDSDLESAPGFGPFQSSISATASVTSADATATAFQDSLIGATSIDAMGTSTGDASTLGGAAPLGTAAATSRFSLTFALTENAAFSAQGYLDVVGSELAQLSLEGPAGTVLSLVNAGPTQTLPIDASGILVAGTYTLFLKADAVVVADPFDDSGSSEFSLLFELAPPDGPIGTRYCTAIANSTGSPGVVTVYGSTLVADDALLLEASDLPTTANIGYFLMGTGRNTFTPPGSAGPICIAPGIKRFLPPVQNTNQSPGGFTRSIGTSGPVSNAITPGSTWNFQAWHRDSAAGTSNLTDAVTVAFL